MSVNKSAVFGVLATKVREGDKVLLDGLTCEVARVSIVGPSVYFAFLEGSSKISSMVVDRDLCLNVRREKAKVTLIKAGDTLGGLGLIMYVGRCQDRITLVLRNEKGDIPISVPQEWTVEAFKVDLKEQGV